VALYEDEVDIHLDPEIGYDWVGRSQQKVLGRSRIGSDTWRGLGRADRGGPPGRGGEGELAVPGPAGEAVPARLGAKMIRVILDDYCIHDNEVVACGLLEAKARILLYFLPPYHPSPTRSRGRGRPCTRG
jgi:hypothetical protein